MGKHLTGTWNCHLTQTSSYLKVKTIGRRMSSWADAASISTCSQESTSCVLSTSFNGTTKSLWSWFTNSSGIQLNCHPWMTFVPKSSNCLLFCQAFVVVCLWPTNVKTMWMIQWPVRTKQSHKTYNTNTNLKQNHKFHNTYAKNSTTQTQTSLCLCCRVLC